LRTAAQPGHLNGVHVMDTMLDRAAAAIGQFTY